MFQKVAIIGPGLIGGSMGLALRKRGLADCVVGIGRRQQSLDKALQVGAVDSATLDAAEGVKGADLVVLATPIGALGALTSQIAPALEPGAVLTDVASTKAGVMASIGAALESRPDVAYVPTHPMAGSEQSGPLAASADLFEGAVCIITPLGDAFADQEGRVRRMWEALGARVVAMTPEAHDRTVARISHLPHLAASALLAVLDEADMEVCGKGLLDTTRVASGRPEIWMDICASNHRQIADALADYAAVLDRLRAMLEGERLDELRELLAAGKHKRDALVERRGTAKDQ